MFAMVSLLYNSFLSGDDVSLNFANYPYTQMYKHFSVMSDKIC